MKYFIVLLAFATGYLFRESQSTQIPSPMVEVNRESQIKKREDHKASANGTNRPPKKNFADCNLYDIEKPNDKQMDENFKQQAKDSIKKFENKKDLTDLEEQLKEARESDDIAEQISLIDKMSKLDPKSAKVFDAKALFFRNQGDFANVRKILLKCLDSLPNHLNCHRQLGNIRTAKPEEVDYHTQKCLEIDPTDSVCLIDRAFFFFQRGRYAEAVPLYKKVIDENLYGSRIREKSRILFFYAQSLELNNQYDEAFEAYEKACQSKHKKSCIILDKLFRTVRCPALSEDAVCLLDQWVFGLFERV